MKRKWDYRVFRRTESDGSFWYAVHAAYYPSRRHKRPDSITVAAVLPVGETADELLRDTVRYMEAFSKPVLDYETHKEVERAPAPQQ